MTPDEMFEPPRNLVEVAVPSGALMESVSVWRVQNGVRVPLRSQPSAGFESRAVYDYEAEFGVPAVYGWESRYVDSSVVTEVWSEDWSDLSAWSASDAFWDVNAGTLYHGPVESVSASLSRDLDAGHYRVEFGAVPVGVLRVDFGGFYIDVPGSRIVSGSQSAVFERGSGAFAVYATQTAALVETSAGTVSVPLAGLMTRVAYVGPVGELSFDRHFGAVEGSGPGQLDHPNGIATDSNYVYVADTSNHRIQKFTKSGVFVTEWGSYGSGPGEFMSPRAITIDSGYIYVCDALNHRVQVFAPPASPSDPHTFDFEFGTEGVGDGEFSTPNGICVDGSYLYISDNGYQFCRIQKFAKADGSFVAKWGSYGTGDGQFGRPMGIAARNNRVYVVDNALHRVQTFTNTGTFVTQFGSQGSTLGKLYAPQGIAVTGAQALYVTEDANRRITKFIPGTDPLNDPHVAVATYGTNGDGPGKFRNPTAVSFHASSNVVWVVDTVNGIQSLPITALAGEPLTTSVFGTTISVEETSDPVTLNPDKGWLIHPGQPGLSFPLTDRALAAGIEEIGDILNDANDTIHHILGSPTPVVTTNGNRRADDTMLAVAIETNVEELALKEMLKDQTPILVNFPPSMGTFFQYGFYRVGTTRRSRKRQQQGSQLRTYELPLLAVRSPSVVQQAAGWSFATLKLAYQSFDEVRAAYATFAALVTDSRNPGY